MSLQSLFGLAAAVAATLSLVPPAAADTVRSQTRAVVELFTSQGCSSCPPADALLTQIAQRDDIVALSYHVDYWDYIGWRDTFGSAAHSDRQRAYAKSWGSSRIYTPQAIVNGTSGVVGSRRDEVEEALAGASLPLGIDLARQDDMLVVDVPARPELADGMVWLVTYIDKADVRIERGENAGKLMSYTQVVTGRHVLGMWEAARGTQLKLPIAEMLGEGDTGLAILVQEDRRGLPGPILAAAAYQL